MALDPQLKLSLSNAQTPRIYKGDNAHTMFLRIFEAVGFDPTSMAWDATPYDLPEGLADLIESAAKELDRQREVQPSWSECVDKTARELVVLLRAWEGATVIGDRQVLSDMIVARQEEMEMHFRYMNESFF